MACFIPTFYVFGFVPKIHVDDCYKGNQSFNNIYRAVYHFLISIFVTYSLIFITSWILKLFHFLAFSFKLSALFMTRIRFVQK